MRVVPEHRQVRKPVDDGHHQEPRRQLGNAVQAQLHSRCRRPHAPQVTTAAGGGQLLLPIVLFTQ
jgi:hypothetical protein